MVCPYRIERSQLRKGAQHAVAFDAADIADGKRHVDAGNIGPGSGKGADEAGAGIRGAADDLDRRAGAGIDHQHLQAVGLRMFFRRDNSGDDEGLERRLVVDILDLQSDLGEPRADFVEAGIRFQMLFQPGEREFHRPNSPFKR